MVPECKPEWNREALTVFSRLLSLRRLQATPPLQTSVVQGSNMPMTCFIGNGTKKSKYYYNKIKPSLKEILIIQTSSRMMKNGYLEVQQGDYWAITEMVPNHLGS